MSGSKLTRANKREGDGRETGGGGQGPFWLSGAVLSEQVSDGHQKLRGLER